MNNPPPAFSTAPFIRPSAANMSNSTRMACNRIRPTATASTGRSLDPLATSALGPPQVLCVGEALYDLLCSDSTAKMTNLSEWTSYAGGAPTNLAAGLCRLSTASAILGNVGDDDAGKELTNLLRNENVNVDGLQTVSGRLTRRVFVRRDETGERSFVGFSGKNPDFADTVAIDPDTLPGVLFYAAQIMVTSTLVLAFPGSRKTVCELVALARMCQLRVIVDINWRSVFWAGQASESEARKMILEYVRSEPGVDIVKIGLNEVVFLFGEELAKTGLENPADVLRAIGGTCTGVIVTDGENGCSYAFSSGMDPVSGRVAAFPVPGEVVDTTGAGDAFLAGFLSEMFQLGGMFALTDADKTRRIAEFASAVASIVVTGMGAIDPIPTREEVEKALAKEGS